MEDRWQAAMDAFNPASSANMESAGALVGSRPDARPPVNQERRPMKLRALMILNAIIAGVFGIGFVLVPEQVMSLYSSETGATLDLLCQLFGAALIGFAALTWLARNAPDSEARRAIVVALFVCDLVGCAVALLAQIDGVVNTLGWSTVAIYFWLAVGFGYFAFAAKREPGTAM
jgi:uncharacterized membrane protein YfcA